MQTISDRYDLTKVFKCVYIFRSIKQDCPAFIHIRVDRKRQRYEVDSMDLNHNHDVSESREKKNDEPDWNVST